jgi:hypothetical protein
MIFNRSLSATEIKQIYNYNGSGENICTDTCSSLNYNCGAQIICGTSTNCGTCGTGQVCDLTGRCATVCIPDCSGKQCGDNGCGGNCGVCSLTNAVSLCDLTNQCIFSTCNSGYSNCDFNTSNGCETQLGTITNCASCGDSCSTGQTCTNNQCVNQTISPTLQTGLVSWLKLDGNAQDSMGINNGTIYGATLTSNGCKSGQCYSLDGVNDYIDLPSYSETNNQSLTYAAWFKTNSFNRSGYQLIIGGENTQDSPNVKGCSILRNSNGYLYGWCANSAGSDKYASSGIGLDTNNWHFVALTYNYSSSNLSLYFDGAVVSSTNMVGYRAQNNPGAIEIGRQFYDYYYFNGLLDEVMIFNRSLSATEIKQIYNNISGDKCSNGEITSCIDNDSCCPSGCTYLNDNNCVHSQQRYIIYAHGDSITADDSWLKYLDSPTRLNSNISARNASNPSQYLYNFAVGGWTCQQVESNFNAVIGNNSVAIILCGINTGQGSSKNKIPMEQIQKDAIAKNVSLIWISVLTATNESYLDPTIPSRIYDLNEWLRTNLTVRYGSTFVDGHRAVWNGTYGFCNPSYCNSDGLHLNSAGQAALADEVWKSAFHYVKFY